MKKQHIAYGVVAVAAVAGVAGLGALWFANSTARSSVADNVVALADFKATDPAALDRGKYVMQSADCAACHTGGKGEFSGSYEFQTPFGTLLSSNITPDRETGIGRMTEHDFFNAVRHGQGSKGFLYPAMPYTSYAKMSDEDLHDLWAYMSTVTPVANKVEENAGMAFPYNQRLAMAGWNLLFYDNRPFQPLTDASAELNRGKYLVEGAGHCAACHTERNALGATVASKDLQGGLLGTWWAPEITGNVHVGLGEKSVQDIVRYLKTGSDGVAIAAGPMAEAVENSTQYMTDADLVAVATYLKSLPGSPAGRPAPQPAESAAMVRGASGYEVHCSACHSPDGRGVPHMITGFAGNGALLADNTSTLTSVVLGGARAVHTKTNVTGAGMPAFDWKLTDEQIADILTYVRNSWGNAAAPVAASDVAAMRKSMEARQPIRAGH